MRRIILAILTFILSLDLIAQQCAFNTNAFQIGEYVEYRIGYSLLGVWVKAGQVSFTVKDTIVDEREQYHFYAYGRTMPKYDWMFKVRDTYESLMDKETLKPTYFHRDVLEGDEEFEKESYFNFDSLKAETCNGQFDITDCTYDVVSAVYYCRGLNWSSYEERDTVPLTLFLDDSCHHVYVRYLGKEEIRTNLGKFRTVKFAPLLIEGTMFEGGEDMTVWVTDDENRIPIRIASPILIGSVKAEIYHWDGLKNPISSLIE